MLHNETILAIKKRSLWSVYFTFRVNLKNCVVCGRSRTILRTKVYRHICCHQERTWSDMRTKMLNQPLDDVLAYVSNSDALSAFSMLEKLCGRVCVRGGKWSMTNMIFELYRVLKDHTEQKLGFSIPPKAYVPHHTHAKHRLSKANQQQPGLPQEFQSCLSSVTNRTLSSPFAIKSFTPPVPVSRVNGDCTLNHRRVLLHTLKQCFQCHGRW